MMTLSSNIKITQKKFVDSIIILFFAIEIAATQAQEQRAKDAKSFRQSLSQNYNSMLIS